MSNILYYESPTLEVQEVQLEEGMVKSSSEVKPEQSGGPQIEDWTDNGDVNGDFEL